MDMDFTGKVAVVTGAANGIGRATALAFAKSGAKVVVVDRDAAGGEATAGIEGSLKHTAEYDEAMFDQVIAVNVKGVFLGLRHVLPVMLQQKSGAIVNTASVAGLVATPGMPAYVASKHAVIGLTKTAAGEVARSGVRVNAVCPGPIDTRMIHSLESMLSPGDPASVGARYQQNIPIGRYGTAEEVANLVEFLCSDLASNITGAQYVADGGRTATGGAVTNNLIR